MIPKNLKPGDTFEDGGRTFMVVARCADGYISKMVDKQEVKEPAKRKRRTAE